MKETMKEHTLELSGHAKVEEAVHSLLQVAATDEPVVSAYLNLSEGPLEAFAELSVRFQAVTAVLPVAQRQTLEGALETMREFLADAGEITHAQGVAMFYRGGEAPFWRPLVFAVPMPTWVLVARLPRLFHLMEAKQSFRNYLVCDVRSSGMRVMELRMGRITENMILDANKDLEEMRQRIGRDEYRERCATKVERHVREQAAWLHGCVMRDPRARLVLRGEKRALASLKRQISSAVQERIVEAADPYTLPVDGALLDLVEGLADVPDEQAVQKCEQLITALQTGGLGCQGTEEVELALACRAVSSLFVDPREVALDEREQLIRVALEGGADIQLLSGKDTLKLRDGVAALLRFRLYSQEGVVS